MKVPTELKCIAYDTQHLSALMSRISFTDLTDSEDDVVQYDERKLVSGLMNDVQICPVILGTLGFNIEAKWCLNVTRPFTDPNTKPGDIDILISDLNTPQHSMAVECKRVKIRPGKEGPETITRMEKMNDGIVQANSLYKLGFNKTYLLLFAVVDGRDKSEYNFMFRGLSKEAYSKIIDYPDWGRLNKAVGVLYIEAVQPVRKGFQQSGMVCLGVMRPAISREQKPEMSERIVKYVNDQR